MAVFQLTSESATEGQPDKVCDLLADSILDCIRAEDRVARVGCEGGITTGLVLRAPGGLWWELGLHNDLLTVYGEVGLQAVFSRSTARDNIAWVRFRKVGGDLLMDAKDGRTGSWQTFWSTPVADLFDAVNLTLDVNVWSVPATDGPYTATFRNFNLP